MLATITQLAAGASDLRLARDLAIWRAHNLGVPLERIATVAQVTGQTVKRWSSKMDETRTLAVNSFKRHGPIRYGCTQCHATVGTPHDYADPEDWRNHLDRETTEADG